MAWRECWTKSATRDIANLSRVQAEKIARAVHEFAVSGTGDFDNDSAGRDLGRLFVDSWRIRLAMKEEHTFVNDDGETETWDDVVVVLGVISVDPATGLTADD